MILALDVHYREETTKAVGVLFQNWTDEIIATSIIQYIDRVEKYIPGEFYKRELHLPFIDFKRNRYLST